MLLLYDTILHWKAPLKNNPVGDEMEKTLQLSGYMG